MANYIDFKLEAVFAEWQERMRRNGSSHFTKDGVLYKNGQQRVDTVNAWLTSPKRIMFLLKDQHQNGVQKWDEDIRYWLKDMEDDTERNLKSKEANRHLTSPFIRMLAYILWGLSKAGTGCDWWYDDVTKHIDEVEHFFNNQPFALVECKKEPGGGSLDDKTLNWHLCEYGDLLWREIEILRPNMIVCTSQHIFNFIVHSYPHEELTGSGSLRFHPQTGALIFCSYHPSAFGMRKSDIYEGVMYHYRAFRNNVSLTK